MVSGKDQQFLLEKVNHTKLFGRLIILGLDFRIKNEFFLTAMFKGGKGIVSMSVISLPSPSPAECSVLLVTVFIFFPWCSSYVRQLHDSCAPGFLFCT